MRKILFVSALLLLSTAAFSQSAWRWGVKAGGNLSLSSVKLDVAGNTNKISADARPGFYGGGFLEFSPGDSDANFKLQLEALYNDMNVRYPMQTSGEGIYADKLNVQQVSIPLLAKLVIAPGLSLELGPTFNINVGGKEKLFQDDNDPGLSTTLNGTNLKSFQLGLAGGAYYYLYKGLFVEARYNHQFGHVNNTGENEPGFEDLNPDKNKVKWDNVQVGFGYRF